MKKLFLGMAAAAAVLGAAEPKIIAQVKTQADLDVSPKVIAVKDGIITINSAKPVYIWNFSKKSFPVNPAKKYTLSWEFRRLPGSKEEATSFYLGIVPLDANGKIIEAVTVNPVNNSDAVLAAGAKKGAKQLIVKDCSKWPKNLQWCNVAFNAQKDLSDLPNSTFVPIVSFAKKDANWIVSLKEPLKADYPAGTAIRLQRQGAGLHYAIYKNKLQAEWTKGSRIYRGAGKREDDGGFRPGTKNVRLFIGVLSKPCTIEIKDFKLTEL